MCSLMSFRQYIPLCSHSHHHIGKHSVSTKRLFVVSLCSHSRQPWPVPSFTSPSDFIYITLHHMQVYCIYLSWYSPSLFFPSYYFFITYLLLLNENQGLPRSFSALDSMLPMQGARVRSLVRELESHMPCGTHTRKTNHSVL